MQETKNNHVVSQVYLNNFSSEAQSSTVYMSSLGDNGWCDPIRPIAIKSACSFQDFYSIVLNGSFDRSLLEGEYKRLFEDNWLKVIGCLNSFPFYAYKGNSFPKQLVFTEVEERTLVSFLHHQYKKSPRMKAKVIQRNDEKISKKKWKKLDEAVSKVGKNRQKTERIVNHMTFTSFLTQSIKNDTGIIEDMLSKKNWILWINNTDIPFVTTDVPVLWFDELKRGQVNLIYAVLTPKFAIEVQANAEAQEKIHCLSVTKEQVEEFNRIMKSYAFSKIVSNDQKVLRKLIVQE